MVELDRDLVILGFRGDCLQETVGENPDERVGRRLREFVSSWRDLDGITAA